jgi:methionyl-tRNA formyltransferase
VRAFDPFPARTPRWTARCSRSGSLKSIALRPLDARCGQILSVGDEGVAVACGRGVLRLTELQRAGGKRLPAREFLAGFALAPGPCLDAAGAPAP